MGYEFVEFKNLSFPQGAYQNGSSLVIYNLAPVEGYGYVAFAAVDNTNKLSSTALDNEARGGTSFRVGTADYSLVGTTSKLHHLNQATGVLTNVSNAVGFPSPYATSSSDWGWSFTRWGNGVAATNGVDDVQFKADITTAAAFATCFTSTLVPKAKFMGLVKNQLMIAHTTETATVFPQRVRWGAVDNIFDMDESTTTQADHQDLLDDYGEITGFVGGEYGLIFKERCIYKATYVGPPLIYRFDMLASGIGTRCPGSIIEYKGSVYFWGANAIYKVNAGGAGVERVPEGIFKQLSAGAEFSFPSEPWPREIVYLKTKPYLVHSAQDPGLGCIYWAFPTEPGKSYVLAVCVEDGRTTIADCAPPSSSNRLQWMIPGTYVGDEHAVYAPSGNFLTNKPKSVLGIDTTKNVVPFSDDTEFHPRIVSGMISSELGKRCVITSIRPAFYSAGKISGATIVSPAKGVRVHEFSYEGIVTSTNSFSIGANGWYHGKANGPYIAIETTFATSMAPAPTATLNVAAGWEIVFDEIGSER